MHNAHSFCASGVLVDLLIQDGLLPAWRLCMVRYVKTPEITTEVVHRYVPLHVWAFVITVNDRTRSSFDEIASYLEAQIGERVTPRRQEDMVRAKT